MAKRHFKKCKRKTQNRVWREQVSKQIAADALLLHAETWFPDAKAMLPPPKSIAITGQKHSYCKLKAYLFHPFFVLFSSKFYLSNLQSIDCQYVAKNAQESRI